MLAGRIGTRPQPEIEPLEAIRKTRPEPRPTARDAIGRERETAGSSASEATGHAAKNAAASFGAAAHRGVSSPFLAQLLGQALDADDEDGPGPSGHQQAVDAYRLADEQGIALFGIAGVEVRI
ncbi:hypothetical protein [Oceanibacterium hippocampi]|uniref:hypothetical protein n=1 Tax=Oceanibacterium hippocampi TaxID=745714 RepID=UPI000A26918C|nr:hypothetical protein [Oceanibacterium hippocampi]